VRAYDVEVAFADYRGKRQASLRCRIDLTPYMSGAFTVRKTIHHAASALTEIQKSVKRWGEGPDGLKVWARDGDAKDERARQLLAERRALRDAAKSAGWQRSTDRRIGRRRRRHCNADTHDRPCWARDRPAGSERWGRVSTMAAPDLPQYQHLLWPTIVAMRDLGGSGSIEEIVERVLEQGDYTEEQQAVLHKDGPSTEIEYRLAWARTYLKGMGLADNSQRGVWSLTDEGRTVTEEMVEPLRQVYLAEMRERRKASQSEEASDAGDSEAVEMSWQERLLDALMLMRPDSFERLAQRLLREAGFISATVTGRSGDGGIDGLGVYRMSLVSFPVFFQCKRYSGSVGAGAVRDFRGAMAGRGDKGLLITTGTFTAEAKAEATRDGAPPLDLIDGKRLCELLKQYDLGVQTTTRVVEDVEVQHDFFADL
jgi:restriction system protein